MAEMKNLKIEVVRYNPEVDTAPHSAFYEVPYDATTSLLDALGYLKDNLAPDPSFPWSCRMAICGSCGMMVNNVPKLACKTFLRDYTDGMKVAALANFPIERDLVVDMTHFIESLEAIKPYIIGNARTVGDVVFNGQRVLCRVSNRLNRIRMDSQNNVVVVLIRRVSCNQRLSSALAILSCHSPADRFEAFLKNIRDPVCAFNISGF